MNYPWHEKQWQQIIKQYEQQVLPHALLLVGSQGLAKKQFALRLAHTILCEQSTIQACGKCHSCNLMQVNNHPDFLLIEPEEKSIGIAEIRELILQLQLTQHSAQYKIIIIHPASSMTHAACNALLKSLEEPPAARTLLILITQALVLLPATIASRCQRMHFLAPSEMALHSWLAAQVKEMPSAVDLNTLALHYNGAPLRILAALNAKELQQITQLQQDLNGLLSQTQNPIALARQWQNFSLLTLLDWMLVWLSLQIKNQIENPTLVQRLFSFMEEVEQAKQILLRQVSLNVLLLLESLFIKCKRVLAC